MLKPAGRTAKKSLISMHDSKSRYFYSSSNLKRYPFQCLRYFSVHGDLLFSAWRTLFSAWIEKISKYLIASSTIKKLKSAKFKIWNITMKSIIVILERQLHRNKLHSLIRKVLFNTLKDILTRSLRSLVKISFLVLKRTTFQISWK